MSQRMWLDIFSKCNPLIHLKPASTTRACEEHLKGVSDILDRLSGMCRTKEIDLTLVNTVKIAVYALNNLTEQLTLIEEKESTKQGEDELTDE